MGLRGEILSGCGLVRVRFEVQIEDLLVRDLGFGEQNGKLVQVLAAFFGGGTSSLGGGLAGFGGFVAALRFEPNFRLPLFGFEL